MHSASILFPGQGSQEPGMGRDLAEHWSEAMDLWKKAEAISGLPLREIYWDNDEAAMAITRNLQPALSVVNINLWRFVSSRLTALAVAGHSLGEYAALCVAGVLSLEDMLKLVCLRGKLMDEACNQDGSMAAILRLDQATVEDLVSAAAKQSGQEIRIANFNTPAQFVISGHVQAVDMVCAAVKPRKGRALILPVCNAFHSPYMDEAGAELARYMGTFDWNDPKTPIYLNVTGQTEVQGQALKKIMQRQMSSSVLWTQTISNQYHNGLRTFVELGPKGALARMVNQILKGKDEISSVSISTLEHATTMETLLS